MQTLLKTLNCRADLAKEETYISVFCFQTCLRHTPSQKPTPTYAYSTVKLCLKTLNCRADLAKDEAYISVFCFQTCLRHTPSQKPTPTYAYSTVKLFVKTLNCRANLAKDETYISVFCFQTCLRHTEPEAHPYLCILNSQTFCKNNQLQGKCLIKSSYTRKK